MKLKIETFNCHYVHNFFELHQSVFKFKACSNSTGVVLKDPFQSGYYATLNI